ncbi:hypothetical protein SLA2020_335940 [Shorea laevis]
MGSGSGFFFDVRSKHEARHGLGSLAVTAASPFVAVSSAVLHRRAVPPPPIVEQPLRAASSTISDDLSLGSPPFFTHSQSRRARCWIRLWAQSIPMSLLPVCQRLGRSPANLAIQRSISLFVRRRLYPQFLRLMVGLLLRMLSCL